MALQNSGAISLADIQTEFGGSNPISLGEYYKGGAYVPSPAPGAYTSYFGTLTVYSWDSDGVILWNGSYITGSASGTTITVGSYDYEQGTQFDFVSGGKGDPGTAYYQVRRRLSSVDNAPNVPTSGSISLSDFYGAS